MKNILFKLYLKSPSVIKRLLANIEAYRRDKYRRFSDVNQLTNEFNFTEDMFNVKNDFDIRKIKKLVDYASNNVLYFKDLSDFKVNNLKEFEKIPLLNKQDIRHNKNALISNEVQKKKELWEGSTSGSTGTPLSFYKDRNSLQINQFINDNYYVFCGYDSTKNRARISGVKVAELSKRKPPYWVYIDKYKQLQCSAFHISKKTYKDYLKAFYEFKIEFGTGFPSGWTALAELMIENDIKYEGIKSIVMDSEGLTLENQKKIEKAFNCPVFNTYGLGEVGMCAIQCKNKKYHILPTHYVEIVGVHGNSLREGEEGEIVVTDYNSFKYPFIRYATGDIGIKSTENCGCGMTTPFLTKITGRIEDYILTKDGRKITRLSSIMKFAIGIKESQIIQVSRDEITINIIPEENFEKSSMDNVLKALIETVGDMEISWRIVNRLERTSNGKVKFMIRKFDKEKSN